MPLKVDPGLAALCGSATRVSVLGALAGASRPFSGYQVAKAAGRQPIKVYAELRRLRDGGLVRETLIGNGRSTWELTDLQVLALFRGRLRVSLWTDWKLGTARSARLARRAAAAAARWDLSKYSANPTAVSSPGEYVRSPVKDRVLARAGLQTSRRRRG